MQLWPHCRKFYVKILKNFCWNSRNCENLMRFPKKLFVKVFVWTGITKFWQACLNHAAKIRRIFFSQSPKRIAMQFFSEKVILSFSSFLQKIKKSSSGHAESSCDNPVRKILVRTLKTLCSNFGKDEKFVRFPNKVVSPQNVRLECTMKFWQAWRNFVAKKTKNFPELQKCWSYNFLNKFIFFIKIDSLATENAILTTVANIFL